MDREKEVALIKEMIDEKCNEIWCEEQCKLGIESGDIEPLDSLQYDKIIGVLANKMVDVLEFQLRTNNLI